MSSTLKRLQQLNESYVKTPLPIITRCDNCGKWRETPQFEETSDVPEYFDCSMWTTDEGRNGNCWMPSDVDEKDECYVDEEYTPGSLVWAKMVGYPRWPAMVEDDPDEEEYRKGFKATAKYHVGFLGDPPSRRWIEAKRLQPFQIPPLGAVGVKSPMQRRKLRRALEEAERAAEMTKKKRLMEFSLAVRLGNKKNTENRATPSKRKCENGEKATTVHREKKSKINQQSKIARPSSTKMNLRSQTKRPTKFDDEDTISVSDTDELRSDSLLSNHSNEKGVPDESSPADNNDKAMNSNFIENLSANGKVYAKYLKSSTEKSLCSQNKRPVLQTNICFLTKLDDEDTRSESDSDELRCDSLLSNHSNEKGVSDESSPADNDKATNSNFKENLSADGNVYAKYLKSSTSTKKNLRSQNKRPVLMTKFCFLANFDDEGTRSVSDPDELRGDSRLLNHSNEKGNPGESSPAENYTATYSNFIENRSADRKVYAKYLKSSTSTKKNLRSQIKRPTKFDDEDTRSVSDTEELRGDSRLSNHNNEKATPMYSNHIENLPIDGMVCAKYLKNSTSFKKNLRSETERPTKFDDEDTRSVSDTDELRGDSRLSNHSNEKGISDESSPADNDEAMYSNFIEKISADKKVHTNCITDRIRPPFFMFHADTEPSDSDADTDPFITYRNTTASSENGSVIDQDQEYYGSEKEAESSENGSVICLDQENYGSENAAESSKNESLKDQEIDSSSSNLVFMQENANYSLESVSE